MTFDGLSGNIAMCSDLGADLHNKLYFKHPVDDYPVFVFLDAAHMLKLLRNALASKHILCDSDGQ